MDVDKNVGRMERWKKKNVTGYRLQVNALQLTTNDNKGRLE